MDLLACSPTSQSTLSAEQRKPVAIDVSMQDGQVECSRIATPSVASPNDGEQSGFHSSRVCLECSPTSRSSTGSSKQDELVENVPTKTAIIKVAIQDEEIQEAEVECSRIATPNMESRNGVRVAVTENLMEALVSTPSSQLTELSPQEDLLAAQPRTPTKISVFMQDGKVECSRIAIPSMAPQDDGRVGEKGYTADPFIEQSVGSPLSRATGLLQQTPLVGLPRKPTKVNVSIQGGEEVECLRISTPCVASPNGGRASQQTQQKPFQVPCTDRSLCSPMPAKNAWKGVSRFILASRKTPASVQNGRAACAQLATNNSVGGDDCSTKDTTTRNPDSTSMASLIAKNPWKLLSIFFLLSIGTSLAGYFLVGFSVSAELDGWLSRGTMIANQNTQITLINQNTLDLFSGGDSVWNELTSNIQNGFIANDPRHGGRRILETASNGTADVMSTMFALPGCDVEYYTKGKFLDHPQNLWPLWKTIDPSVSFLDPPVLRDLCVAEHHTQTELHAAGHCGGCAEGGCLPPISLVSFARMLVGDRDGSMDCDLLSEAWVAALPVVNARLLDVVAELRNSVRSEAKAIDFSDPYNVVALLVDSAYGVDGNEKIRYTSSIFATAYSGKAAHEVFTSREQFDRAESSSHINGVFDTAGGDFSKLATDPLLVADMKLVAGSLVVTILAILTHTGSVWLTVVGLFQIALSFPLAYIFYNVVLGFDFFPFLNFVGVFVIFAIGADDIFVASDKWKNARLENPQMPTAEVAAIALPSAAKGMFLTTVTTTIAFLATGIFCAVPALKLFALFSGLLIVFDYILCLVLIFPALCIFDEWRGGEDKRCSWPSMSRSGNNCHTRRCLSMYYSVIHRWRFLLLVVVVALSIGCSLVTRTLSLPNSSEVRVLRPENEFERNHRWRQKLLSSELERERGTRVWFIWGVAPADTGNHNSPEESSTLVLDESFDPSPAQNQLYLRDFCDDLYFQGFSSETTDITDCPMQYFDSWLGQQAAAADPHPDYTNHCHNATQLPLRPEHLHQCMISFAQAEQYKRILFNNGKVLVIRLPFRQSGASWDIGHARLSQSWHQLNDFTTTRNDLMAPPGVNNVYGSSRDFWWYDTNESVLHSAIGSLGVVLGAVYVTVLLSNKSFVVTFAAVISIGFILLSAAAVLVLFGWTYGFLEAVCFAILVGTSCDFVLHFGYAYCSLPGHVDRHQRTKHAVVTMGPSILAAAATTVAASVALLFASINFFFMFGSVLLCSVTMGIFGSLVVFVVLLDVFGPGRTNGRESRKATGNLAGAVCPTVMPPKRRRTTKRIASIAKLKEID